MSQLNHHAPDLARILELDFLRCTEMAALNTLQWIGKGNKELADEAACDAIRGMFDKMDIRGTVVIGEGIKDEAPGLFRDERVGQWSKESLPFDIAIDPIDGTTNVSLGMPNAISCLAASSGSNNGEPCLLDIPAYYMDKLAYSAKVVEARAANPRLPIDINAPIEDVITTVAGIMDKEIRDVVVMVLKRPRNEALIEKIRSCGAALRMIQDGDITAALAPALDESGVDLYAGIGGAPEGVLSAAGLRCLGGGMQAKIWPRDDEERQSLVEAGWADKFDKVYYADELASGEEILFCATGINESPLLKGIRFRGTTAITHSVIMRVRSGTVRFLFTDHNLKTKTMRLRSTGEEVRMVGGGHGGIVTPFIQTTEAEIRHLT